MKLLNLRDSRQHSSFWRWLVRLATVGVAAWLLLAVAAAFVRAEEHPAPGAGPGPGAETSWDTDERWISLGLLSGTTLHDPALANYQMSTALEAGFGAQGLAGFGRFAAGLRLWTATTQQTIGASDPSNPKLRMTSSEAVAQGRLGRLGGAELVAVASVGWLHLGYHPDQVTVSSGASPIVVDLAPMDEWIAGGGLAVKHRLGAHWGLGLEVDRRIFGLDTAHRSGSTIVEQREWFGDWSAHLELARLIDR
jgi:hypothetical protein